MTIQHATFHFETRSWKVDILNPIDISIPLHFSGPQPNAFHLPPATSRAFRAGEFVGDVREGGSANCDTITLSPHGNGTHTECIGHITKERVSVGEVLQQAFFSALLLTTPCSQLSDTQETYAGHHQAEDQVISKRALQDSFSQLGLSLSNHQALIIRTLPNSESKKYAQHGGQNPPYFTSEAIQWIAERSYEHLLVDFPSVDREDDGGTLPNHHTFWDVVHGQAGVTSAKTITEMIFVPSEVPDGECLLNLQTPHFMLDAAPSRPFLFRVSDHS